MDIDVNASVSEKLFIQTRQLRILLYAVTPNETSFPETHLVPDYVLQASPYFAVLLILEIFLAQVRGKPYHAINDGISSISAGLISQTHSLLVRSIELVSYTYIFSNFCLVHLPWDSPWTWLLGFLGVDFGYYWAHRMGHEINLMWAAHQAHHSSEYYNLTTALRQSAVQRYGAWLFYLPMALCVPPSTFYVHLQFNLLYQFWIHTETIKSLGPLDYILNTPSDHRVHHGRNPYCIDKNYGGTLIIWDHLFGTFAHEEEPVVYGHVHPINTFDPILIQFQHHAHMFRMMRVTPGLSNKLAVIFKGPGWSPGLPRLGDPKDLPKVTGKEKPYNPVIPGWLTTYSIAHIVWTIMFYHSVEARIQMLPFSAGLILVAFIVLTLWSVALLLDGRVSTGWLEIWRCGLYLLGDWWLFVDSPVQILPSLSQAFFVASATFWMVHFVSSDTSA
uniref:alkylglycerol monooxygenase n=1 Tax=Myxine glutinosa TaxID=7769 RepID=UPI00358F68BC